jgi:DNA-directed RNA polymerase subunit RPC12/RpoP
MAIRAIDEGGVHVGTLHAAYACDQCGEPLAIFWVATPLGALPVAADLAAQPVANCPRCGHQVDALTLFGPAAGTAPAVNHRGSSRGVD